MSHWVGEKVGTALVLKQDGVRVYTYGDTNVRQKLFLLRCECGAEFVRTEASLYGNESKGRSPYCDPCGQMHRRTRMKAMRAKGA